MPRIILILLLIGVLFYLFYRFRQLATEKKKQILKILVASLFAGLLAVLALSGRLNWLIAAVGALIPLIPRAARFLLGVWPSAKPYFQRYQQNHQSSMQTRFIHLQINMLNGELQGEVLEGEFAGQKLQMMSLERLLMLLEQCKQQDAESAALLVAYLNRQHGGWAKDEDQPYSQNTTDSEMSVQQARDILGITDTASKKEIINAHKRLMQKLHPDRGGSDYLAQQINRARDMLLKGL